MKVKLAILFALCLALSGTGARAQTAAPPETADEETAKAPAVRLKALDGKTYDTRRAGRGRRASFGATWAPLVCD